MRNPVNSTDPVIDVDELRCRYGRFEAVRGVSFAVRPGELFALLGTNGAGKTTTMETLEGHRRADGGTVRVFGGDPVRERAAVRARTGIMLQDSGFAGELTVAETVRMWRSMVSRPGEVTDSLARLDLAGRADVRVKQLSGGERRRLDLALALFGDPELVFLDEPTTGLDPESRQATWDVITGLLERGSTVLLTTHYLEEAERLADRLAIMHEGRVAVAGSIGEVLATQPARIGCALPDGVSAGDLPALRGDVDAEELAQGRLRVRTATLQDDLAALLAWAGNRGLALAELRAADASLADVFHGVREPA